MDIHRIRILLYPFWILLSHPNVAFRVCGKHILVFISRFIKVRAVRQHLTGFLCPLDYCVIVITCSWKGISGIHLQVVLKVCKIGIHILELLCFLFFIFSRSLRLDFVPLFLLVFLSNNEYKTEILFTWMCSHSAYRIISSFGYVASRCPSSDVNYHL